MLVIYVTTIFAFSVAISLIVQHIKDLLTARNLENGNGSLQEEKHSLKKSGKELLSRPH